MISRRGQVQVITMDDGKVNLLNEEMMAALTDALSSVEAAIKATVLTGREGCLSAGFDRAAVTSSPAHASTIFARATQLYRAVAQAPRPVIIACPGHAIAAGALLLLSGDFRLGVPGPGQIGFTETEIGLAMPPLGVALARARLHAPDVLRALLTGRRYTPEQALAAGFLDELVPPGGDLTDRAVDIAAQLGRMPARAYLATRQMLWNAIWKDTKAMAPQSAGQPA